MRSLLDQAAEELQAGDAASAEGRVRLALHACGTSDCSASIVARAHVMAGVIQATEHADVTAATSEFAQALRLDPTARPDPASITPTVRQAFLRARNDVLSGAPSPSPSNPPPSPTPAPAPAEPPPGVDTERPPGMGGDTTPTHDSAPEPQPEPAVAPTDEAAAPAPTLPEYYRFSVEIGGGVGMPWLTGNPTYEEYRVWDGQSTASCGRLNPDGTEPLMCGPISNPGFGYEGFVSIALRYNFGKRAGLALFARIQPDSSSVGILPWLFLGGRLYVALNHDGYVPRTLVPSVFLGTGVGQMQATVPSDGAPSAHIVSGLNNFHAGARLEYGIGILHVGAELSFNFQIPNFLFVTDLQAVAGLHF